jgi:uncharacterized protein (TIGR00661 family)
MATIFYGVMGEGRGHAARALTLIEQLRPRHRIVVFTSLDALDFLRRAYEHDSTNVEIRATEGIRFHYTAGRIDLVKTIREGLGVWWRSQSLQQPMIDAIDRERPELVLTDFEPLIARAAQRRGVPIVSIDHQHFLVAYDLSSLPFGLRLYAWNMTWCVWAFGLRQTSTVISAFYKPPLRPRWKSAIQVGPLLRPSLRSMPSTRGGHWLSYLRRHTPPRVVDVLASLDLPIRIYGLGPQPARGKLTFHEVDETAFTRDLASCEAVIAAAGNQLLGESLYFGKPVFALPEQKHHEQCINAHFLKQLGGGDWAHLETVDEAALRSFVAQADTFRRQLAGRSDEFDGTDRAVAVVEQMLKNTPLPLRCA